MGYELHITRADEWMESASTPIPEDEWMGVVRADASLMLDTDESYTRQTDDGGEEVIHPVKWSAHPKRVEVAFWYMGGEITTKSPDEAAVIKAVQLARLLDARAVGDDDEVYELSGDGTLTVDGEPFKADNPAPPSAWSQAPSGDPRTAGRSGSERTPTADPPAPSEVMRPDYGLVVIVLALIVAALWWAMSSRGT